MNDTERLNDHEHVYRCQDCGEIQDISALLDEARKETLTDLRGWIDRNHYQPVNEADRWVQASGEIIAEIDTRVSTLTPRKEQ